MGWDGIGWRWDGMAWDGLGRMREEGRKRTEARKKKKKTEHRRKGERKKKEAGKEGSQQSKAQHYTPPPPDRPLPAEITLIGFGPLAEEWTLARMTICKRVQPRLIAIGPGCTPRPSALHLLDSFATHP